MTCLSYTYDSRGFGELRLMDGERVIDQYTARTGSIDTYGNLVNAIPPDKWEMRDAPVDTAEMGMWITSPHNGWKARLYRHGKYSHYLIHPDGGAGGTRGCIGIQGTDALSFRDELAHAIEQQGTIDMHVLFGNPYGQGVATESKT